MSHTPLHRATVLLLNTTPRGALRPPSSPSATKNKLARFTVRSSGCPRARARERSPSPTLSPFLSHSHSPPFFLSHTLSLTLSLSRSLARSRSRFTSCNAADTFIRAFGPFSDTLAHLSRSTTDRPTNRPTDRPTNRSILSKRGGGSVAAHCRLSPLPPSSLPPPPPLPPPPSCVG